MTNTFGTINIEDSGDVYVDCSDDEKYDIKLKNGEWLPPPEDVITLYEAIDDGKNLVLEWQCPGRRPPTPAESTQMSQSLDETVDEQQMDKSDFDFREEMSHLNLAVRPTGDNTPKGSAKKKTTTFDAVLSNMARHRRLNMIPDNAGNNSGGN